MSLLEGSKLTDPQPERTLRVEATPRSLESPPVAHAVLFGIVLVGITLRCYRLPDRSFWFDEAFCWRLIQFPWSELPQRVALDNHPPLYFVLLKAWAAVFGTSVWALRGLSVLLGGVTIVVMYLFVVEAKRMDLGLAHDLSGKRAGPREVGLFVAACVALSVFQIRWAWEVRMYTLGTALAALSSWCLLRAIRSEGTLGPWLLYALVTVLFSYSHYYALFSIAGQAVFLAGLVLVRSRGHLRAPNKKGSDRLKPLRTKGSDPFLLGALRSLCHDAMLWKALLSGAIIALAWLPWVPFFLAQRTQVQTSFWTTPIRAWTVPNLCYDMLAEPENPTRTHTLAALSAILCGGILVGILVSNRKSSWYIFTAAVAPLSLSVIITMLDTKIFSLRYFLFAQLFLWAALGMLIGQWPVPLERRLINLVILGSMLYAYYEFHKKLDIAHKPGARAAGEWIAAKGESGDPIVVGSPLLFLSIAYHAPAGSHVYLFNETGFVAHYAGGAALKADDFINAEDLARLATKRVWLVDKKGSGWPPSHVRIDEPWQEKSHRIFPEVYQVQGEVLVREYVQNGS